MAGIAAEHNLPFLVISAGTRNHFALDLGLDREDPTGCLDALRDGVELHVDLGKINGRTFVNNSSFGVYAEVVQSPEYRDDKTGTVLQMLPDLIKGDKGARLHAQFDGTTVDGPQAVLVSNGPYGSHDLAGLGRRTRLDRGVLGAVALSASSTREAVGLLRRATKRGLVQRTAVGGGGRRRCARDPGRRGRRGAAAAHPGAVHGGTCRPAGPGSAEASGRPARPAGAGPGPAPRAGVGAPDGVARRAYASGRSRGTRGFAAARVEK